MENLHSEHPQFFGENELFFLGNLAWSFIGNAENTIAFSGGVSLHFYREG
jgi:hypothetical protein